MSASCHIGDSVLRDTWKASVNCTPCQKLASSSSFPDLPWVLSAFAESRNFPSAWVYRHGSGVFSGAGEFAPTPTSLGLREPRELVRSCTAVLLGSSTGSSGIAPRKKCSLFVLGPYLMILMVYSWVCTPGGAWGCHNLWHRGC